jgi:NAD(P)H-dependent FMN reductase
VVPVVTFECLMGSNAGGSFNRMTAKVLHSQISRNVLTYVDDIIVKSTKQENHVADLQETFANFRQAGLKLNPKNVSSE